MHKAEEHADKRGLSLAGGADQRDDLAGRGLKAGAAYYLRTRGIREIYILKLQRVCAAVELFPAARLLAQLRQLPDTPCGDGACHGRGQHTHKP